ncbi:C-type lectin domain family 4 member E-like, partial [Eucyclogobius newberryi]|uniref:C-type lectin domain family 4 member E-like n=1 Tax=Eucyclogobius newberryi TaxID=166745 RepID=UPI003B5C5C9C
FNTVPVSTCSTKLQCETNWKLNGRKCYYFSTNKFSWIKSKTFCESMDGRLVKIDSREEQLFLYEKLRTLMSEGEDKFWIGLTDSEAEGVWKWTDGSSLNPSLTFWFKGKNKTEPDNWTGVDPEGEDCVRMGEQTDNYQEKSWFDQNCDTPQRFICEKNPTTVCQ